jgi:hypothetical protein
VIRSGFSEILQRSAPRSVLALDNEWPRLCHSFELVDDRVVRIAAERTEPVCAIETIAPGLHLLYSPLDGGFFFQSYEDGWRKVSVTYKTRPDALTAKDQIYWDPEAGVTYANEDEWLAWWRSRWGIEFYCAEIWVTGYDDSARPVCSDLMIEGW